MEIVNVEREDVPAEPLRWWRDSIDCVGRPGFAGVMMQCFSEAVQADVWSLVRLNNGAPEGIEMAVGRYGEGPWLESGRQFVQLYGPFDPMRSVEPSALDERWQVGLVEARDIYHPAYRAYCYDSFRLRRRLSTRIRCQSGDFQVNAYGFDAGKFSFTADAVAGFVNVTKVLAASVDRHLRERAPNGEAPSVGPVTLAAVEQQLLVLNRGLSRREVQVLALAACGHSVSDSAGILGLSDTSVFTYRRRGLAKLDVANAKELLRVLLGQAVRA